MVTATVELKSAEKDRSGFCKVSLSRVSFAVLIHSTSLALTGTLQQKRRQKRKERERTMMNCGNAWVSELSKRKNGALSGKPES